MKYLTFDIEDWFHILDYSETKSSLSWNNFEKRIHIGTSLILELLEKHEQKAIFFCLGWVADNYPGIIKKIHDSGHIIGSHSDKHQLIYEQSYSEFEIDTRNSISKISNITGQSVKWYRAPGFSITKSNQWAFDILAKEGIIYDSSIFPSKRGHGGFINFPSSEPCEIITAEGNKIIEFPIGTRSIFGISYVYSGGGYFRLIPQSLLKFYFHRDPYIMTYFHPRDFDKKQPILHGLSPLRKFKSYYGIGGCLKKLDEIIKANKFTNELDYPEKYYQLKTINLTEIFK